MSCTHILHAYMLNIIIMRIAKSHLPWKEFWITEVWQICKKTFENVNNYLITLSVSSVARSCLTLCGPMDCSMPGCPILYYLLEIAQTHVHWVSDAKQPSHPLSPLLLLPSVFPSIKVFSISQLFASGGQNIRASASASVFPMNIQGWFP